MTIFQALIIGILGLFLKYVISVILSTPWYEKEDTIISDEEYEQYITQAKRSVQKDGKIFHDEDMTSVIEDGMALMKKDNFNIAVVET